MPASGLRGSVRLTSVSRRGPAMAACLEVNLSLGDLDYAFRAEGAPGDLCRFHGRALNVNVEGIPVHSDGSATELRLFQGDTLVTCNPILIPPPLAEDAPSPAIPNSSLGSDEQKESLFEVESTPTQETVVGPRQVAQAPPPPSPSPAVELHARSSRGSSPGSHALVLTQASSTSANAPIAGPQLTLAEAAESPAKEKRPAQKRSSSLLLKSPASVHAAGEPPSPSSVPSLSPPLANQAPSSPLTLSSPPPPPPPPPAKADRATAARKSTSRAKQASSLLRTEVEPLLPRRNLDSSLSKEELSPQIQHEEQEQSSANAQQQPPSPPSPPPEGFTPPLASPLPPCDAPVLPTPSEAAPPSCASPVCNLTQNHKAASSWKVKWDASPGAVEYLVLVQGSDAPSTTSATTFAASNVPPGTSVLVKVAARSADGLVSDWSSVQVFTQASVPEPPFVLTPDRVSSDVTIKWKEPNSCNGSSVGEYRMEVAKGLNSKDFDIAYSGSDLFYRLGNLPPSTHFSVRVRARNAQGWSTWSNIVGFTTPNAKISPTPDNLQIMIQDAKTKAWRALAGGDELPLGRVARASWTLPPPDESDHFVRTVLQCREVSSEEPPAVLSYTLATHHILPCLTAFRIEDGSLVYDASLEQGSDWRPLVDLQDEDNVVWENTQSQECTWETIVTGHPKHKRFLLRPGGVYELFAYGHTAARDTPACKPVRLRVATSWPTPPKNLSIQHINVAAGKVTLQWDPVGTGADGGDAVVHYVVEVRSKPEQQQQHEYEVDSGLSRGKPPLVVVESAEALERLLHPPPPTPSPPPPPSKTLLVRERVDAQYQGEWYHATVRETPEYVPELSEYYVRVFFDGFDDEQHVPLSNIRSEFFVTQPVLYEKDGSWVQGEILSSTLSGYMIKSKSADPVRDVLTNSVRAMPELELPSAKAAAPLPVPQSPSPTVPCSSSSPSPSADWTAMYQGPKTQCSLVLPLVKLCEARVAAANAAHGLGQFSAPVHLKPLTGSLLGTPKGISVRLSKKDVTSLVVPPVLDDAGVAASQFQVQSAVVERTHSLPTGGEAVLLQAPMSDWGFKVDVHDTTMLILEKLPPGKQVCVRVRAKGAGSLVSAWSEAIKVDVPAVCPGKVDSVTIFEEKGGVFARWTPAATNGSQVTKYLVLCRHAPKGGRPQGEYARVEASGSSTQCEILATGAFQPGARVEARVQAVNAIGDGPYSETVSIVTTPLRPGPPEKIDATPTSSTVIAVELAQPLNNGGAKISGFEVKAVGGGGHEKLVSAAVAKAVLTGLRPGTMYEISARCINSAGAGPWSSPLIKASTLAPPPPLKVPSSLSYAVEPATKDATRERLGLRLSWECDLTGDYEVDVRLASGGDKANKPFCTLTASKCLSVLTPITLPASTKMRFRVKQLGRGVESAASEWCTFTTTPIPPAPPTPPPPSTVVLPSTPHNVSSNRDTKNQTEVQKKRVEQARLSKALSEAKQKASPWESFVDFLKSAILLVWRGLGWLVLVLAFAVKLGETWIQVAAALVFFVAWYQANCRGVVKYLLAQVSPSVEVKLKQPAEELDENGLKKFFKEE